MPPRNTLLEFVDERIDSLLRVPEMWGSEESIELQLLLLLEVRLLALSPALKSEVPKIQQAYVQYLQSKFPGEPPEPLAMLLNRHGRLDELSSLLDDEPERSRSPRHYAS